MIELFLYLYSFFFFFLEIVAAYLLADFLVGFNHWIKDSYFSPTTPIIGKSMIWSSRLHHIRPRHILEYSDTELFIESAKWTVPWIAPLMIYTGPTTFMITLLSVISCNDVIHKYAHAQDSERPYLMTLAQNLGIFQSYDEHRIHHTMPHESHYCPITPYINRVLEPLDFWRKMEWIIEFVFGIRARSCDCDIVEDTEYPANIRFIDCK